jgi:hypothetical protein
MANGVTVVTKEPYGLARQQPGWCSMQYWIRVGENFLQKHQRAVHELHVHTLARAREGPCARKQGLGFKSNIKRWSSKGIIRTAQPE